MEKKKSIGKNYVYNLIYQILLIIIPLATTPYVSRVLLPSGVGQYSFCYSLITYFTIFATLGFGYYAQREIAKCRDNKKSQSVVFWEINLCRLIPVLFSLVVNVVLITTGVYQGYSFLMTILCINIVAVALDISFLFQGNEDFGITVLINIIIKIIGTASIFVFVKTQNDVWIYTLIHSATTILSNLVMWIFLPKVLSRVETKELRPMRHFVGTLRLFIPNLAISLYALLDKSLIGFITNESAQNGFYEQAEKIVKMAMTIVLAIGPVMISRNAYEISLGNQDNVRENNYKSIHFLWLLGIPMMLGLILVSDNLVEWFLGADFINSSVLIKALSPLILIIGLSNVIGLQYMIPNKMDRRFTIAVSVGALINLILNIPLIMWFKSLGAAIATIASELTVTIVMFVMARKHLSFKKVLKLSLKPVISGAIMFGALFPLQMFLRSSIINTIIIVSVGVVVYFAFIFILKDSLAISIFNGVINKFKKKSATIENKVQVEKDSRVEAVDNEQESEKVNDENTES